MLILYILTYASIGQEVKRKVSTEQMQKSKKAKKQTQKTRKGLDNNVTAEIFDIKYYTCIHMLC